ncbi:MAG TPA: aminomethyl-transferring glycine dehydrogenase [Thermodesulfobacteriota bacterium]|nr:aminomethyl-transferring glycine dehydrogenase [Thermodesulfobacteriota bacterium]
MKTNLEKGNSFALRHIGPDETELQEMLRIIGSDSLDSLIEETIPSAIRLKKPLNLPKGVSEYRFLEDLRNVVKQNKVFKSYIGLGYYDSITPCVIQRNILENPGWYTQYTPYQAEISQGRLEALLNFQTMVVDLTKMEVANASLLDEGTAAAEAMTMIARLRDKSAAERNANVFFVSEKCFPQTIELLKTRAAPLGIELIIGDHSKFEFNGRTFGAILQYPNANGEIFDLSGFINNAHSAGALVAVATDLLSLTLITPPGEFGADVVVGSSQRFGVPLGYGGPHAAFFATREKFTRQVPGRIIGVSIDSHGNPAYRMALQTREQHIKREKATSNICTAEALLAFMASMYAVYHGPKGLKTIAEKIHALAKVLELELNKLGFEQTNSCFFDTLKVNLGKESAEKLEKIKSLANDAQINFRYIDGQHVGISLDETTQVEDIQQIIQIFARAAGKNYHNGEFETPLEKIEISFPDKLSRRSDFLTHPVFKRFHSETQMLRYIKSLENKDLSLTISMIPLGSCTMKLNATAEMIPLSWAEFSKLHPFAPVEQAQGYAQVFKELEGALSEITGFPAVSLQPNSGAQGEYAGLMVIKAYYHDKGQGDRNVVLVPSSAHGTNPASAAMAGMKVVVVECDEEGNIDVEDLKNNASKWRDNLAAIMITYPSTHGVFEERIQELCAIVHENGGQVYMDGANMNAQVGLTSPAIIGADVCHLNLHKTFSIPHGGGGPGMGPICVAKHLAPYLPSHPLIPTGGEKAISAVASAPWGSASILLISYAYVKMLGAEGATDATRYAILNANYIKSRLEKYYPVLYKGGKGRVAHEFILDLRELKKSADIEVEDIAKRLMDYGFHAPTMSWPVAGTMMIEPTESEAKDELDRFCDAMIAIYREVKEITDGTQDIQDNVLKNAPHTAGEATGDDWKHPYSRAKAVYPLPFVQNNKFWPSVGRINNPYGDRNLVCTCPTVEAYTEEST